MRFQNGAARFVGGVGFLERFRGRKGIPFQLVEDGFPWGQKSIVLLGGHSASSWWLNQPI